MGWVVNATPRPLYPRERDPVPIVQEAGLAAGPVRTGAENLAPPGFDPRTVQLVASRYTDPQQDRRESSKSRTVRPKTRQSAACQRRVLVALHCSQDDNKTHPVACIIVPNTGSSLSPITCRHCSLSPITCQHCSLSPITCRHCSLSPITCRHCSLSPITCRHCIISPHT
jgi:hypothetical protein